MPISFSTPPLSLFFTHTHKHANTRQETLQRASCAFSPRCTRLVAGQSRHAPVCICERSRGRRACLVIQTLLPVVLLDSNRNYCPGYDCRVADAMRMSPWPVPHPIHRQSSFSWSVAHTLLPLHVALPTRGLGLCHGDPVPGVSLENPDKGMGVRAARSSISSLASKDVVDAGSVLCCTSCHRRGT
jgi:hypothetical protein